MMRLRQHDIDECRTLYPEHDPLWLLDYSLKTSLETFSFFEGTELIAVGGVAEAPDRPGYTVWLVGSPLMDKPKNHRRVLKEGRQLLKRLVSKYYRLSNYCSSDASQVKSMRLLGFEVHETDREDMRFIEICA